MSRSRPRSYQEPDGCWNCRHVFVRTECDGGAEYFCLLGGGPRPLCGSVGMDETGRLDLRDRSSYESEIRRYETVRDQWDWWSKYRTVRPWGKCGCHRKHWYRGRYSRCQQGGVIEWPTDPGSTAPSA